MVDISKVRHMLLAAMFLLALGALVLHFSTYSPFNENGELNFTNAMASLFPLVDVILVTWLFSRKKTAAWGYLLNGLLVIYGTVFMTHCGWAKVYSPEAPLWRYIVTPTSPNIIIAWADFFMGAVLYKLWFLPTPSAAKPAEQSAA
jgi:hypothetical protein